MFIFVHWFLKTYISESCFYFSIMPKELNINNIEIMEQ